MFAQYSIFFCLLWCSGQLCAAQTQLYAYQYIQGGDGWLRLQNLTATWSDALMRCDLEGGVLATPSNSAVTAAMRDMMVHGPAPADVVLIGKRPSYPWSEDSSGINDCLAMTNNGNIIDANCTTSYRYFCYKSNAKMESLSCATWDREYHRDERTGSCYKFHPSPVSWYEAEETCRSEHAHLAVINSETERQVLQEFFNQHPQDSLQTADNGYAYIGFWDWQENGSWMTVFGQTFEEAGFGTWGAGEPNHAYGREFCGALRRDGYHNDYFCDGHISFICEISPFSSHVDKYVTPETK